MGCVATVQKRRAKTGVIDARQSRQRSHGTMQPVTFTAGTGMLHERVEFESAN